VAVSYLVNDQLNARLAPSYSSGITQLRLSLNNPGEVSVTVYDIGGKRVKGLVPNHRTAGEHNIPLDLTSLQQGVYLINVRLGNSSSLLKYIKQ
jgi:hypothetical protein